MSDPTTSAEFLEIGTVIEERYEVVSVLGEGGFGVVYKARQISTQQFVAIKLLHPNKLVGAANANAEIERFRREMAMIGQLKHPNLVRLIDTGTLADGQLFTVLEFVEGEELADVLAREGALDLRETVRLMGQVLEALGVAHAKGVVHRDLKPHNIMIARSGRRRNAMVLDFGIATLVEDARGGDFVSVTKTGQIHGTPAYMAPEQLEGQITPQSDVYAWALVFVECLTGRPVIEADSVASAIFQQLSPDPVALPDSLTHTAIRELVAKAADKNPATRYLSAEAVLSDLEHIELASTSMPLAQVTQGGQSMARPDTVRETLALEDTVDPESAAARLGTVPIPEADDNSGEFVHTNKTRSLAEDEARDVASQRGPEDTSASPSRPAWMMPIGILIVLGLLGGGAWLVLGGQTTEESAETVENPSESCSPGQEVTEDTQGQCCYPGQAWNGDKCVGQPASCPEGYLINGAAQTCSLPPCDNGMARVDDTHCCWPEQGWSETQDRCIGVASCPDRFIPHNEECLAANDESYLLYTSCDAGNTEECVQLALHLQAGTEGVQRSTTKAAELLETACNASSPHGCYYLGIAKRLGMGIERDRSRAEALFVQACDAGHREACFDLASLVDEGGTTADISRTMVLLQKACDSGHVMSCDVLGSRYRYADGVVRNLDKAAELYSVSCKGGYLYACTHLAWMYRDGVGTPTNDAMAAQLLSAACENGETLACGHLADMIDQQRAPDDFDGGVLELRRVACTDGWYAACDAMESSADAP